MRYRVCACLLTVLSIASCSTPIGFVRPDSISIFRQAIDARNRGDVDSLMKFFASDAIREDGSCNPPCVGEIAVRRSFEKNVAEHFQATLTAVEGSGDTVTGRAEIRSDAFRAQGVDHRTTSYTIKFREGKIVRWSSPLPGAPPQASPTQ